MAPCTCINELITPPVCEAITPPAQTLHQSAMCVHSAMAFVLDCSACCGNSCGSPPPLRGACAPGCAEPNARTHTGRRCTLLACFETLPGHHFSQSFFCGVNSLHCARPADNCGFLGLLVYSICHRY